MREIVAALIDDTSRQIELLRAAIGARTRSSAPGWPTTPKAPARTSAPTPPRLYSSRSRRTAARGEFDECGASLATLAQEVERLREEQTQ